MWQSSASSAPFEQSFFPSQTSVRSTHSDVDASHLKCSPVQLLLPFLFSSPLFLFASELQFVSRPGGQSALQFSSSEPSTQSRTPSHLQSITMQDVKMLEVEDLHRKWCGPHSTLRLDLQVKTFSSEPSRQSWSPSHTQFDGIQNLLLHWNCLTLQLVFPCTKIKDKM